MNYGKIYENMQIMFENMQKFLKICNNTSKYAENMQKSKKCKKNLNFCLIYSFFGSFKPLALF